MSKLAGWLEIIGGTLLAVVAVAPTPDDPTIASPLIQAGAGTALIIDGIKRIDKSRKKER